MTKHDHSKNRPVGEVRVRWFGEGESRVIKGRNRVDTVLAKAAKRWYRSNHSPDRFVMAVVIERDGARMTDEEADEYLRDELASKRCIREFPGG